MAVAVHTQTPWRPVGEADHYSRQSDTGIQPLYARPYTGTNRQVTSDVSVSLKEEARFDTRTLVEPLRAAITDVAAFSIFLGLAAWFLL